MPTRPNVARLLALLDDLTGLQPPYRRPTHQWFAAARDEIHWLLGADHPLAQEFSRIAWQPVGLFLPGAVTRPSTTRAVCERARLKARDVLVSVLVEVDAAEPEVSNTPRE